MIPSHLQKLPHIGQQAQALPALAPNMLLLPEQRMLLLLHKPPFQQRQWSPAIGGQHFFWVLEN
jgi:hypothetical protein